VCGFEKVRGIESVGWATVVVANGGGIQGCMLTAAHTGEIDVACVLHGSSGAVQGRVARSGQEVEGTLQFLWLAEDILQEKGHSSTGRNG